MNKEIYINLGQGLNGDVLGTKILGVSSSLDDAKQCWTTSYSKIGFPTFVRNSDAITRVFHPLDKNCQVGEILTYELWSGPQHL